MNSNKEASTLEELLEDDIKNENSFFQISNNKSFAMDYQNYQTGPFGDFMDSINNALSGQNITAILNVPQKKGGLISDLYMIVSDSLLDNIDNYHDPPYLNKRF